MSSYETFSNWLQQQTSDELTYNLTSILTDISHDTGLSITDMSKLITITLSKVNVGSTDINWTMFSLDDFLQLLPTLPAESEFDLYIILKLYLQQLNFLPEDSWLILTDNIYWMSLTAYDIQKLRQLDDQLAVGAALTYQSPVRERFFIPQNLIEFNPVDGRFYTQDGLEVSALTPLTSYAQTSFPSLSPIFNIKTMLSNYVVSDAVPVGIKDI